MELSESLKQKVSNYKPSDHARDVLGNARVLLLVAISGGGKDTIKHRLLETSDYRHIISYTTRSPRENHGTLEQDGVDYHFIDFATADRMLDEGKYIEADVYAGNIYGTGTPDIEQAHAEGKIATTDMTIEGAAHFLALAPSVKAVFLLPPSYDIWRRRLEARNGGAQNKQDMKLRMQEAVGEIELALKSDNMYIVINDDLEETIQLVDEIAHGEEVEPHYHKAVDISNQLLARLHEELGK
jgi:guanylate kinase